MPTNTADIFYFIADMKLLPVFLNRNLNIWERHFKELIFIFNDEILRKEV